MKFNQLLDLDPSKHYPAGSSNRGAGLEMPIQFMPGVGPYRAELLAKLGIRTPDELLHHFPREHQDRRVRTIREIRIGQKGTVQVEVKDVQYKRLGPRLGQARAVVADSTGAIEAVWFKNFSFKYDVFSSLRRDLNKGVILQLFGQMVSGRRGPALRVELYEKGPFSNVVTLHTNRLVPIYPLTEGIRDRWFRELISKGLARYGAAVSDPLPAGFVRQLNLPSYREALFRYHYPRDKGERDWARERLAFDEFFILELALELSRQSRTQQSKGYASHPKRTLLSAFRRNLGHEFTSSQVRVINEIFRDMARSSPMNRLLQGDVGSGKTVVALSAALLAVENRLQVAFLAPTEILATQHALSFQKFFAGLSLRWGVLTGSTRAEERKAILSDLRDGRLDVLVGTHAILNEQVQFQKLGLVVIDEQHRFGVRQRSRLINRSTEQLLETTHPDTLIMTATPIPRTLALTLYGDLDISVLDEMPSGRSPVRTKFAREDEAFGMIRSAVARSEQAYIVFPLIEESEASLKPSGKSARAAKKEYERLQSHFSSESIGLLHGQMKPEEKKNVMDRFRRGEISILVATPVIEVGIDVPAATHMVVMSPHRFGLAQLHQLRGRVGRGTIPSNCLLVQDEDEEAGERLQIFCSVSNGFKLAEEDMKIRGPGEILGEAQHGVPFFKVGDIISDGLLIGRAREAAKRLVLGNIPLTMLEFQRLNRTLQSRFGHKIHLSQVG